MVVKHLLVTH